MAPFPDNLPPEGLDPVLKLLIYFGILYILSTAITTWLITRRRSFPKTQESSRETAEARETVVQTSVGITEALNFDDTKDRLSSLKVEVQGAEAALKKLNTLHQSDQLSQAAYQKLAEKYNSLVSDLTTEMNQMLQSDITGSTGEINEGISDEEMEEIEADLEKQLMDLDNDDDFLRSRPKKKIDDIFTEDKTRSQPAEPSPPPATTDSIPSASTPAPKATPPSTPKTTPTATEPKRVPMPPAPGKDAPKPGSQPSGASTPQAPPKPSEKKSVPMPPPPKKASAPPPPKKAEATKASQPLSAAQPMKVQSEDEEGMFAKSTSIAALRMDMLRELARLKKLIPEDQDKDQ